MDPEYLLDLKPHSYTAGIVAVSGKLRYILYLVQLVMEYYNVISNILSFKYLL